MNRLLRHRAAILLFVAAGGVVLVALFALRDRTVRADELDYLRAGVGSGAIIVIGAWDAPGGHTLVSARHERRGGRLILRLGARPSLSGRRIFEVRIATVPGDPALIHLEEGNGALRPVPVGPAPPSLGAFAAVAVRVESRADE